MLSVFIFNQMNKGSSLKTLSACVSLQLLTPLNGARCPGMGPALQDRSDAEGASPSPFFLLINCPTGRESLLHISLGWSGMDRSC